MNELVERLSIKESHVIFEKRTKSLEEVKRRIEDGFVFVTFTETKGQTELGIDLESELSDLSKANFEDGTGEIKISGTCELNYEKVRCKATIDLSTKEGSGILIPLQATCDTTA